MTNSGHSSDQGGEHGGAMDKLKSVWREAVGTRDDDEDRQEHRGDGSGARPAPSGTAHPADVRPDVSARNASGMHPADDGTGPVVQQRQDTPQQVGAVPRQQQGPPAQARVPQEQTVGAGAPAAQGGPAWGATPAPPAPTSDDRAERQVPRQAAPTSRPGQAGAGGGTTGTMDGRPDEEFVDEPNDRSAATTTTDDADATSTDTSQGRHELFEAQGRSTGSATATAGAPGSANTAARDEDTDTTVDGHVDGQVDGQVDGRSTSGGRAGGSAAGQDVPADPDKFVPAERATAFAARWSELKGDFVDEPRDAVRKADALVGDVLDEIAKVFTEQRSRLEHDLDTDSTSTEDLRQAMHRYRKFFERLLNI
jgi:hypothetical protein